VEQTGKSVSFSHKTGRMPVPQIPIKKLWHTTTLFPQKDELIFLIEYIN
jgi:hypothetical protein